MAFGGQKFLRPNPPPWLSPYLISRKIGTKRPVWATKNSVLPQNSVSLVLELASISSVPYRISTRSSFSPGARTRDNHRCDARQGGSVLGANLLTGYLKVPFRCKSALGTQSWPSILGALVWVGLYLRDSRIRILIPIRM